MELPRNDGSGVKMNEDFYDWSADARASLQVLRILNDAGKLDQRSAAEGFACLGRAISHMERMYNGDLIRTLPVRTMADIVAAARSATVIEGRFSVIEGGRRDGH